MFLNEKLPVAAQTAAPDKPKRQVEIEIFVDPKYGRMPTLRVEPRKVLEAEAVNEIIDVLGFPLKGPEAEVVLTAAGIATKYGWEPFDQFLDGDRHLHVKLRKEVDA